MDFMNRRERRKLRMVPGNRLVPSRIHSSLCSLCVILLEKLTSWHYHPGMIATITAKGQITIPLALRQRFHLHAGDQLEFDETAPVLTARRVVDQKAWKKTMADWQKSAAKALKGHPWDKQTSTALIDDLRGGPAEPAPATE